MKFKMGAAEIKAARKQPGGSNVGKKTFASGKPRTGPYAGPSGGAPKGSYPIPDKAHAKAAIKMSGHAPNPSGIKSSVYRKYPELKPENKKQDGSKNVKSFPDLNKDGKVSRADVLVGRGVIPAKKMQEGTEGAKTNKKEYTEEQKKYLQHQGSIPSPETLKKKGIPLVGPPIRKGASADSTGYFAKKVDDLEKMERGVIREMNNSKAPKTKISKEVSNRKLSKSDEFAHKYLTSQPKVLSKIRDAQDEAKDNFWRQGDKGDKGVIFNYDKDGHFIGPKSSDKKMCGSKGMKYAEGTKSIKFKKPMMKRADGSTSQRGLWDNIRANKGSGKKPTPEMLKQEKKIKAGK